MFHEFMLCIIKNSTDQFWHFFCLLSEFKHASDRLVVMDTDTLTLPHTNTSSDTLNNTNIDVDIGESGPGVYLASRWNQILSQRPSRLLGPPRSFSRLISQLVSACLSAR